MLQRLKHFVIAHNSQAQRCRQTCQVTDQLFVQKSTPLNKHKSIICLKFSHQCKMRRQLTINIKGNCLKKIKFSHQIALRKVNVRWDGNLRRHIAKYIHFLNSRRNGNKGVDEMGQKTVDEMGLDEMGCYLFNP